MRWSCMSFVHFHYERYISLEKVMNTYCVSKYSHFSIYAHCLKITKNVSFFKNLANWSFWVIFKQLVAKNRRWPNLKMILTSLLTFIGLCFYQSTVRLNFSKALNFSYAYMQIAGFLKLFKLDICTKEIRFSHFRFPQKCGSINTSHFSCMSVASGLCFDFSLLISTWLLHCRVLVAR